MGAWLQEALGPQDVPPLNQEPVLGLDGEWVA